MNTEMPSPGRHQGRGRNRGPPAHHFLGQSHPRYGIAEGRPRTPGTRSNSARRASRNPARAEDGQPARHRAEASSTTSRCWHTDSAISAPELPHLSAADSALSAAGIATIEERSHVIWAILAFGSLMRRFERRRDSSWRAPPSETPQQSGDLKGCSLRTLYIFARS